MAASIDLRRRPQRPHQVHQSPLPSSRAVRLGQRGGRCKFAQRLKWLEAMARRSEITVLTFSGRRYQIVHEANVADLATVVKENGTNWLTPEVEFRLRNQFARDGFIKIPEIAPGPVREAVTQEVFRLLEEHAERRDLLLATTGNTPRFMSVVRSEIIAENSPLIEGLYRSDALSSLLGRIAGESLHVCPSQDEEFLITRQERMNDTHGWHWGDFSFALIWLIVAPPISYGGMLQCVPHTKWDKQNPRIHEHLCENPIRTYGFVSGDVYFLRTDTTLHRTVPLNGDTTRIILNMTWAAEKDLRGSLQGDDRWWENSAAVAAQSVDA